MNYTHIINAVPDFQAIPTVEEMLERTQALRISKHPMVSVRTLGISRHGDPIELISVGAGKLNALLVGTPHPNEPIGCLTIEFLIDQFSQDAALARQLDFTWHFIKTIEPDGLRLNEGWLKRVHDAQAYLANFFRPAFSEQAEYTFPLTVDGYTFDDPTPENKAWREAIRLVKPDLMVSLHNAEHGGCFHILSRDVGNLAERLSAQPEKYGIPVSLAGDPFSEMRSLASGVFQFSGMAAGLRASPEPTGWKAGDSSFGYAESLGTLGLIIEVPYWTEVENGTSEAGAASTNAAVDRIATWGAETIELLERHRGLFETPGIGLEERFACALREALPLVHQLCNAFRAHAGTPAFAAGAAEQQRGMRMYLLRPVAMLERLSNSIERRTANGELFESAVSACTESSVLLRRALDEPWLAAGMKPLPLQASVRLQVDAILTSAQALQGVVQQKISGT